RKEILMNIIDIIILVIIGLSTLSGYRKGFILSLFSVLRLFLSIIIARAIYPHVMDFLTQNTNIYNRINNFIYPKIEGLTNGQSLFTANTISDLIISLVIMFVIYLIINLLLSIVIRTIDSFFKLPILNTLNKFSGLIFGIIKGFLIVFIIYALLTPVIALDGQGLIASKTMESMLGKYFYRPGFLIDYLKNNYLYLMNIL
ncbi:CvpA family protein, partial [Senegalia sp. (in: firmicutes)]|uniref:CvpA family protein n=2 Tax=Senegalia sp. (in: firmicutes) TaxID=1924098 RepID=UPI003F9A2063